MVAELREMKLQEAARKIEAGVEETLTYFEFPAEHWTRIRVAMLFLYQINGGNPCSCLIQRHNSNLHVYFPSQPLRRNGSILSPLRNVAVHWNIFLD